MTTTGTCVVRLAGRPATRTTTTPRQHVTLATPAAHPGDPRVVAGQAIFRRTTVRGFMASAVTKCEGYQAPSARPTVREFDQTPAPPPPAQPVWRGAPAGHASAPPLLRSRRRSWQKTPSGRHPAAASRRGRNVGVDRVEHAGAGDRDPRTLEASGAGASIGSPFGPCGPLAPLADAASVERADARATISAMIMAPAYPAQSTTLWRRTPTNGSSAATYTMSPRTLATFDAA